jgi:pyruvate/2-oxoglutarate dehydrogenase complex dihydrolipoamide dehydrogenase (E3) component
VTAYDAIVIGTGQAGPYVTSRLAGAGMKVAVIERNAFGGTCVNTGCIPTKTIIHILLAVVVVLIHNIRERRLV